MRLLRFARNEIKKGPGPFSIERRKKAPRRIILKPTGINPKNERVDSHPS